MINPEALYRELVDNGVGFFCGVPDSLLKNFCAYIASGQKNHPHVITANEGNAVAQAAGFYLASGKLGLVYMQNSGLGNAVNPLMSLAHSAVYQVPMVLLIGWRGEPGIKDEPQHQAQGAITISMLESMGITTEVLPAEEPVALETVKRLCEVAIKNSAPVALVVHEKTFEKITEVTTPSVSYPLTREEALEVVVSTVTDAAFVSTTGKLSRELFELRERHQQGHAFDFLTVGSMGHASSIASGIALASSDRPIYCLDGDGAALMHLGSMAVAGQQQLPNLRHIIFNNGVHDSVGGQLSAGFSVDFVEIAKACGYPVALTAQTTDEIKNALAALQKSDAPAFLEIKIKTGDRADLGRPTTTPVENKNSFMAYLQNKNA